MRGYTGTTARERVTDLQDVAMAGYLKLHRKVIDHHVFANDWLWRLFCWCLLKANFKPGRFGGHEIPVGSFVTGRLRAAEELNVSPSKWYRGIQTLCGDDYGCISIKSNNHWTTITVCNYRLYQTDDKPKRTTNEQPANNQRTTDEQPADTIEEGKNSIREEGKHTKAVGVPDLWRLAQEFVDRWNSTIGTKHVRSVSHLDPGLVVERFGDPAWTNLYPEALEKFPLKYFKPNGMPVAKFLEDGVIHAVLGDKYDFEPSNGRPEPAKPNSKLTDFITPEGT